MLHVLRELFKLVRHDPQRLQATIAWVCLGADISLYFLPAFLYGLRQEAHIFLRAFDAFKWCFPSFIQDNTSVVLQLCSFQSSSTSKGRSSAQSCGSRIASVQVAGMTNLLVRFGTERI